MEHPDSKYCKAFELRETLPTLAQSKDVHKHVSKGFGKKRVEPILAMMKRGKLEGELRDEILDFFEDLISNTAHVVWTGYLRGNEDYPVDILEYEKVYFVAAEGENTGYFLDIGEAKSFISLNWFGDVSDDVQEDEESEGEGELD